MGRLVLVFIGLVLGISYEASCTNPNVEVKCNGTHMEVRLARSHIPDRDSRNLHLNDPACRATTTSEVISLRTALDACGTTYKNYSDIMEFENEVKDDQKHVSPNEVVTRQGTTLLRIYCKYARGQYASTSYVWRTTPIPTTTSAPTTTQSSKVTCTKGFWVFVVISLSLSLITNEYQ